jgi:hypothetical protein
MSVIDDIAVAMDRYPEDETTIEIINVVRSDGSNDTDVNELENWDFNVKLTNNGHVNMSNVSLHVLGLNGTKVREKPLAGETPGAFVVGMVVGDLNPNGGGDSRTTRVLQFKAPPDTKPAGTQLLHAHVENWDAETAFDHFFSNHTKSDTEATDLGITYPRAFHLAQVFPA